MNKYCMLGYVSSTLLISPIPLVIRFTVTDGVLVPQDTDNSCLKTSRSSTF